MEVEGLWFERGLQFYSEDIEVFLYICGFLPLLFPEKKEEGRDGVGRA
jgi:hypothetical protein